MGESTCLMQQPFSYAAGIPTNTQEGSAFQALGQSISFGRFVSEKLDWEKWSTFSSHNKYVEEAERYARPGSVAQKKAFFEAHYKKLAAARKAAAEALLEQEKNKEAQENVTAPESENLSAHDSQTVSGKFQKDLKTLDTDEFESKSSHKKDGVEKREALGGDHSVVERKVLAENSMGIDPKNKVPVNDNGTTRKENHMKIASPKKDETNKKDKDSSAPKRMEKPVLKTSNGNQEESLPTSRTKPAFSSSSSSYGKPSKPLYIPTLEHSKKEISATPISRKSRMNRTEKRHLTPKSGHKSHSFTPAKEFNRLTSIIRKIDGSRVNSSGSKTSEDCQTPLRTPNKASVGGTVKNLLPTPLSENRRGRMAADSSAKGSKTTRARWHFLPTENKLYSPSCFTPFGLRTEERAARRKKKLEEKFKATEAQKQQHQPTIKEKAEKEPSKLQQRFCFKARPLPSFYKERATPKALLLHHESPAQERKPINTNINVVQSKRSHTSVRSQLAT